MLVDAEQAYNEWLNLRVSGRWDEESRPHQASMGEIARSAGVSKGTLFLYFPSKEALLMALHERNVGAFFEALIARLDSTEALTIDAVLAVVHRQMIEPPLFLPLASRCFGVMHQAVEPEAVEPE